MERVPLRNAIGRSLGDGGAEECAIGDKSTGGAACGRGRRV